MKKNKKLYKKILILGIFIYVVFTLVNQQKTINQYTADCEALDVKIAEQQEYKEELAKKKEDVNSLEYIEQNAREKLEMYYPNERIYIDRGI